MDATEAAPAAAEAPHCCICLSDVTDDPAVLDGCTHNYCLDCILAWAARESRCPVCRARFSTVVTATATHAVAKKDQTYVWDGVVTAEDVEDVEGITCDICGAGDREDELLLCHRFEACGACAHASCLGLPGVPGDDWSCEACTRAAERRARPRARLAAQAQDVEPLADGVGLPDWISLELSATAPSDVEHLFMERPPSPDAARERRWVQRQRAITASVDAQRAEDDMALAGSGRRARMLHRTALRTVGEMRSNWEQLRQGVLAFPALQAVAPPQQLQPRARTLLPGAREPVAAPPRSNAVAASGAEDAVERSWEVLAALAAQPQARAPARPSRPPAAAAAPGRNEGHLEHLAFARRWREQRQSQAASRREQRNPSPPAASAVAAPRTGGGFRIPKRKADDA